MELLRKKSLEKQGYRVVGNHSAIKPCLWCKQAIKGKDVCYKNTFYGIRSWRCIQASVSVDNCNQKCTWCWRDVNIPQSKDLTEVDEPKEILDGFIREQKKALEGYYGCDGVDEVRVREAMEPKHVALSLTGETCLYPKLPEMVEEIRRRKMTSFIVSNGTIPSMTKKLIAAKPTQFYITLPAPDKKTYLDVCSPLIQDGWERIMESLNLLGKFKRGTVRLTLTKNVNMINPEGYASILKDTDFKFLELKAAMPVGYARYRMEYTQMPLHQEIRKFSEKLAEKGGWKIIDEKQNSRVVLVMKEDFDERKMDFKD